MTYISILRGINVAGKNKIKMHELSALYKNLGFTEVKSYIQSGNVLFSTTIENPDIVEKMIEEAIRNQYAFDVTLQVRVKSELENIIMNCPFNPVDIVVNGTKVLVTFLKERPAEESVVSLMQHVVPPEELYIKGREVYLFCPNGYGKTKLSNVFIEKKLGVSATTRNWKTVEKLYELIS